MKCNYELGDTLFDFGLLRFDFVENPGMAFGFSFGSIFSKYLLSLFRVFAVFAIGYYIIGYNLMYPLGNWSIEGFLSGIELSCFVLSDGENYLTLPMAKDYKRIGEGDTGLNTGGMGAVSPVPFLDSSFEKKISAQIIKPTIEGLKKDKMPYKGFLFIGLIKVGDEPKVIEYNVRLGDPETEVVIPRVKNDLVEIFKSVQEGTLNGIQLDIESKAAATVMAVSKGYPQDYEKGKTIKGLSKGKMIFHAGTKHINNNIVSNGGRVLNFIAKSKSFKDSREVVINLIKKINWKNGFYRKDIGYKVIDE